MTYHAGDSLGVFPRNPAGLVDEVIARFGFDPETAMVVEDGSQRPLRAVLESGYTLNRANKKFVGIVAEKLPAGADKEKLLGILASDEALADYIFTRDFVDIHREFPAAQFAPQEFVSALNKVMPRLYSIASSPMVHPTEVHLTVAVIAYVTHDRPKTGLASGFLGEQMPSGEKSTPVYIQPTRHFHLPPDTSADMIMVGPGTGIAPFRAFLQQRKATGAKGRNWLFFGDQHEAADFLYRDELEAWVNEGLLTRLDTAFSRDQASKIYVQHRMLQNGEQLWDWLSRGAYFYVCGDAKRMAKDVHQTLVDIAVRHGNLSVEAAAEYVNITLPKTEKRYLKDVY